jgi:hypothetical protein
MGTRASLSKRHDRDWLCFRSVVSKTSTQSFAQLLFCDLSSIKNFGIKISLSIWKRKSEVIFQNQKLHISDTSLLVLCSIFYKPRTIFLSTSSSKYIKLQKLPKSSSWRCTANAPKIKTCFIIFGCLFPRNPPDSF